MTNSHTGNNDDKSRKKLVRWLVILGIGIPVLVELLTLFNLINVQFTGEENKPANTPEPVEERAVAEGDTLFKTSGAPITVQTMQINVKPQEWEFELILAYTGHEPPPAERINIDSLLLNSGTVLQTGNYEWKSEEEPTQLEAEWELPPGDIPTRLFISALPADSSDSLRSMHQQIKLDKIPVRYNSDQ